MDTAPFIQIDDTTLSLSDATHVLEQTGDLAPIIGVIVRHHALQESLSHFAGKYDNQRLVDLAIRSFCLDRDITNEAELDRWLSINGLDMETFRNNIRMDVMLEHFKIQLTDPLMEEYFEERRPFLKQTVLSRVVLDTEEKARLLLEEIGSGNLSFEGAAFNNSKGVERVSNGMIGPVLSVELPEQLRLWTARAARGDIFGPMIRHGGWEIYRFECHVEPSVEDPLTARQLRDELFEKWLVERILKLEIRVNID